jgi:hypothetical protein
LEPRWIALQVINSELNGFRSWRCEVERDLFGVLVVSVTFGRVTRTGRTLRHAMLRPSISYAECWRGGLAPTSAVARHIGLLVRPVSRSCRDCRRLDEIRLRLAS